MSPAEATYEGQDGRHRLRGLRGRGPDPGRTSGRSGPDGQALRQLTDAPGLDICPAYSADGKQIAFCSNRTGAYEIWVMDANGKHERQVTDLGHAVALPRLLPRREPDRVLGTLRSSVGSPTCGRSVRGWRPDPLTDTPDVAEKLPVWSPDGSTLLYVAATPANSSGQLWTLDVPPVRTQLTFDPTFKDQTPDWSPDGRRIAYDADDDIWLMDADGTDQVNLTQTPSVDEFGTAFSPDGTEIAFTGTGGPGAGGRALRPGDGGRRLRPPHPGRADARTAAGGARVAAAGSGPMSARSADGRAGLVVAAGLVVDSGPSQAAGDTIVVTTTIQAAVDAADPGDTVLVPAGHLRRDRRRDRARHHHPWLRAARCSTAPASASRSASASGRSTARGSTGSPSTGSRSAGTPAAGASSAGSTTSGSPGRDTSTTRCTGCSRCAAPTAASTTTRSRAPSTPACTSASAPTCWSTTTSPTTTPSAWRSSCPAGSSSRTTWRPTTRSARWSRSRRCGRQGHRRRARAPQRPVRATTSPTPSPTGLLGGLPGGVGIVNVAGDHVRIIDNVVSGNRSGGIGVVSLPPEVLAARPGPGPLTRRRRGPRQRRPRQRLRPRPAAGAASRSRRGLGPHRQPVLRGAPGHPHLPARPPGLRVTQDARCAFGVAAGGGCPRSSG